MKYDVYAPDLCKLTFELLALKAVS